MLLTSFSEEGYHLYGKRFVQTALQHTDEDIVIYYEGNDYIEESGPRIITRDLYEVEGMIDLLAKLGENAVFRGQVMADGKPFYSYRHDAYKFCKKVVAITDHAMNYSEGELFAWVDGDVYFHNDTPHKFLYELLPGDNYLSYIGRNTMYSECGFMVFDTSHVVNRLFMTLYRDIYMTGAFSHCAETHDSYLFDMIRLLTRVPAFNLSPENVDEQHPFVKTKLARWMDHLKGNRKNLEKSPELKLTR